MYTNNIFILKQLRATEVPISHFVKSAILHSTYNRLDSYSGYLVGKSTHDGSP